MRSRNITQLTVAVVAAWLATMPVTALAAGSQTTHYTAASKAAESITGNLVLKEYGGLVRSIVFANGKSIALTGAGKDGVYLVTPPADPVLLAGNHLCGRGRRATRVALSWGIRGAFSMSVYTGKSMLDITLCGTFNYTTK